MTRLTKNKIDVQTRQLKQKKASQLKDLYLRKELRDWNHVGTFLNIKVPEKYSMFNMLALLDFSKEWIDGDDEDYRIDTNTSKVCKSSLDSIPRPFYGSVQLFPEQQWVVDPIFEALGFGSPCCSAVYHDNRTGGGKTYVAGAITHKLIDSGILNSPQYMFTHTLVRVFTPKPVCIQYERVFRDMGLGEYIDDGRIIIDNYAALYSSRSGELLTETYDPARDEAVVTWRATSRPALVICDEAHVLSNINTKQTRFMRALLRDSPTTAWLAFSATPFIKVNDCYMLATGTRRPIWNGMFVDDTNFKLFAATLSDEPHKPNLEGIKRMKAQLAPFIISAPYVKWPSRQVNSVLCCDMESEADREIYETAAERLRQKTIALGKNPDHRFKLMVELNAFANTAEPLRSHFFADKVLYNWRTGDKATLIATRNKDTIIKVVHKLIKAGMRRDQLSIIWGGVDSYNPKDLFTIDEARKMVFSTDDLDAATFSKIQKTFRYYEDQIRHDETPEQQQERHNLLRSWGLYGAQTADARQSEVDRFQSGKSLACLFTCAAGGTGLSLDKNKPSLLDRELYSSPSFNARQVAQANGRTVRRATVQRMVYQYMCFLRGTVEESIIMPYMDTKLACMAGFNKTNIDLAKVWLNAMSGETVATPTRVRDLLQAVEDAQSDDSQIIDNATEEEEDDEDE